MATPEPVELGGPDLDAAGSPYPPFAHTAEQRRRWDYSVETARQLFADDGMLGEGPTPTRPADLIMAARAIYFGDIPTGDPPEAVKAGHPLAGQAQPADGEAEAGASSDGGAASGSSSGEEPPQTAEMDGGARTDRETPGAGASESTVPTEDAPPAV